MPPLPGEERLVTLFADVHYYFSRPSPRPNRHRFDKSSYFYIYYNSTRRTSRIEIANHPGTEFQDAIHGHLDRCRISNSKRFPTLTTIEVDAVRESKASSPHDTDEWKLNSADSRESRQEQHKLHTLDIYFWTQEDARSAAGFFSQLLQPAQLDLADVASPESATHHDTVSPVVQNLENVAISDPAYRNGQTRNSQNQPQGQKAVQNIPPPPPPPPQPQSASRSTTTASTDSPDSRHEAAKYTPVAYNPAAPAAPEPRIHREKTPPPEDDGHGTGLKAATAQDSGYQPGMNPSQKYGNSAAPYQPQPQHQRFGSSPSTTATPGYGSPSPPVGYGSPPSRNQTESTRTASSIPSFAPPPTSTTSTAVTSFDPHRHSTAAELYVPSHFNTDENASHSNSHTPLETPGAQFYNTLPSEKQPLKHVQPRYPEYFPQQPQPYNHPHDIPQQQHDPYAIHNQVYRPTSAEGHGHGRNHSSSSKQRPSKGGGDGSRPPASPQSGGGGGGGGGGGTFSRLKGFGKNLGREADKKINGYVDRVEKGKFA